MTDRLSVLLNCGTAVVNFQSSLVRSLLALSVSLTSTPVSGFTYPKWHLSKEEDFFGEVVKVNCVSNPLPRSGSTEKLMFSAV